MSQSLKEATVSFLTLNALLSIYENQPMEFYDSTQMISQPKLSSLIAMPWYLNLLFAMGAILSRDTTKNIHNISSILVNIAVIIQNLNCHLPKPMNVILIYYQLVLLIHPIYTLLGKLYEGYLTKHTNSSFDELISKNFSKSSSKKTIIKEKKKKITKKLVEPKNQIMELVPEEMELINQEEIINDVCTLQKLDSVDQTVQDTELETDNMFDINHADLSEISSIKSEPKLQFHLKYNGQLKELECTYDQFDVSFEFLTNSHKEEQIRQIKIHLLLNLYDNNDDCWCRLWALQKILSLQ